METTRTVGKFTYNVGEGNTVQVDTEDGPEMRTMCYIWAHDEEGNEYILDGFHTPWMRVAERKLAEVVKYAQKGYTPAASKKWFKPERPRTEEEGRALELELEARDLEVEAGMAEAGRFRSNHYMYM